MKKIIIIILTVFFLVSSLNYSYADFTLPNEDGNLNQIMVLNEDNVVNWEDDPAVEDLNMFAEIGFLSFIMITIYFLLYRKGYQLFSIIAWSGFSVLSMAILDGVARYIGFFAFLTCIIVYIIWFKEKGAKILSAKLNDGKI